MEPVVIVDGNNLAQIKYALHGAPVTLQIDRAVIRALVAWVERQREHCRVDLILDPRLVHPEGGKSVHVHVVLPGETADAHIRDHVRHCVLTKKPCVVISDDGELVEYAGRQGAYVIPVSEFIKYPNFLNLPAACYDKNSYPYFLNTGPGVVEDQSAGGNSMRIGLNAQLRELPKKSTLPAENMLDVHERTLRDKPVATAHVEQVTGRREAYVRQMLRLNFDTWPLEDGFQFLTGCICGLHQREYQSLLGKPAGAVQADLYSYYHFALELCGAEADFYYRGVSLMDKVRLMLLQAYPDGVALDVVEAAFGEYSAFAHKLKVHSGKSIELYELME